MTDEEIADIWILARRVGKTMQLKHDAQGLNFGVQVTCLLFYLILCKYSSHLCMIC